MEWKLCPFCDNELGGHMCARGLVPKSKHPLYWIMCLFCQATGPKRRTEKEAIEGWEKRK